MIDFFDPLRHSLTRDDPSPFAAPPQFGPFRVLHQIGVGALGPVFRTYEPERDRLVAVKAFRIDLTPEQAQALADELSRAAGAGLFHPSIVEPIAAGVEGSVAYGAEEYVAAESLDVALRDYAPASIETVLPFITQLAGAIDFARAAGVGHGGLHPRDIFMTPDEARATGFGVVEALERVGFRAPVRRPYSPPERIAGVTWGTPADVFSLAAITYELLTARRPAGLGHEIGALTAGVSTPWMDGIHAVLVRGMAAEPSDRFQTALAFAAALENAAHDALPGEESEIEPAVGVVPIVAAAPLPEEPVSWPTEPAFVQPLDESAAEPDFARSPEPGPAAYADEPLAYASDDAVAERKEEAQYQLTLQDTEAADDGLRLEGVLSSHRETDRFMTDVAAAASAPQDALDDFRVGGTPAGLTPGDDGRGFDPEPEQAPHAFIGDDPVPFVAPPTPVVPAAAASPVRPLPHAPARPYSEPAAAPTGLPIALVLIAGLAAGLGGGYMLWGRSAAPASSEASTAQAPPREFSEQAVAPAPASQPRTGTDSGGSSARATPPTPVPESKPAPAAPAPAAAVPPPAARPATGTIVVRSAPTGAGVIVNGTWRGRTPLTLENLPFRGYSVRVTQPGFLGDNERITLDAGAPTREVTLRLRPQPKALPAPAARAPAAAARSSAPTTFTGAIFVDSRPQGARVSIDGKPVGVTPLRVPEVRIGTRIVRLELPDHRIWSSTARVTAGQESKVTGSLERIQ